MASGGWNKTDKYLSSCELYNAAVCQWSPIAPLNIGRCWHAAATHDCTVYVFGGSDYKTRRDEIEQYDADANKWTLLKARLSQARTELAATCVHSRIYILGGETNECIEADSMDIFDAVNQECRPVSKLPQARMGHAVACYSVSDS